MDPMGSLALFLFHETHDGMHGSRWQRMKLTLKQHRWQRMDPMGSLALLHATQMNGMSGSRWCQVAERMKQPNPPHQHRWQRMDPIGSLALSHA